MWTRKFWVATAERVVRGAAVAVFGVFFVGDFVFDAFNADTWEQFGSVAIGGAVGSLVLALAGGAFGSGAGPALTGAEVLDPPP